MQQSNQVKALTPIVNPSYFPPAKGKKSDIPDGKSALEFRLPHITERICILWGDKGFENFIGELLMDSRDGERKGIPWDAAQELLFLQQLSIAKRAAVAAEITGLPFKQVYRSMLHNAENTKKTADASWNNPSLNPDSRTMAPQGKQQYDAAKLGVGAPPRKKAPEKPKSLWRKIFG